MLDPMANGPSGSKTYRLVTAALGLLFVAAALAILVVSDRTAGPVLAAVIVGLLGVDAIASAIRKKRSLLSRIGPLP